MCLLIMSLWSGMFWGSPSLCGLWVLSLSKMKISLCLTSVCICVLLIWSYEVITSRFSESCHFFQSISTDRFFQAFHVAFCNCSAGQVWKNESGCCSWLISGYQFLCFFEICPLKMKIGLTMQIILIVAWFSFMQNSISYDFFWFWVKSDWD